MEETPETLAREGDIRLPYEVEIAGVEGDLEDVVREASILIRLEDEPPATLLGIRRRAEDDVDRVRRELRALGYYGAEVSYAMDGESDPVTVTLTIEPDVPYRLTGFSVNYDVPALAGDPSVPQDIGAVTLTAGDPAEAEAILDAIDSIGQQVRDAGYPYAEVTGHTARVNHDTRSVAVAVEVAAGPPATFGDMRIEGLDRVEEGYVRRQILWQPGEQYSDDTVQRSRGRLLATGLFDTVQMRFPKDPPTDGRLPMTVEVKEADHRSIGAGARYSSSLGPSVRLFWEHRNLLGADEDLRTELEVGTSVQELSAKFLKPDFRRRDQDLKTEVSITREQFDAFDSEGVTFSAGLERDAWTNWRVGAGVSAEFARIQETGEPEEDTLLFGLPLLANRDTTDSRLDPRSGTRLSLSATPYAGRFEKAVFFTRTLATVSGYLPLDEDRDFVLAGRAAYGTILFTRRGSVPVDKRFFAGGGGSVRGYGFQLAGPLDENGDPEGGQSVMEFATELRVQVGESFGFTTFVDAGRAYTDHVPDLGEDLLYAAGLGLRYYSPVGPLRADIAVPLNPRDVDDDFQFYISLGQAF